jgi:hypothetical protein
MRHISFRATSLIMLSLLILLMFLACPGCNRKPRKDPFADVPDLPADTVYVSRVINRCNYQYLNADPKKAEKQLVRAEQLFDSLIMAYDPMLKWKGKIAITMLNEIEKIKHNHNAETKN